MGPVRGTGIESRENQGGARQGVGARTAETAFGNLNGNQFWGSGVSARGAEGSSVTVQRPGVSPRGGSGAIHLSVGRQGISARGAQETSDTIQSLGVSARSAEGPSLPVGGQGVPARGAQGTPVTIQSSGVSARSAEGPSLPVGGQGVPARENERPSLSVQRPGISARDGSGAFHVPVGGQGVPARDRSGAFHVPVGGQGVPARENERPSLSVQRPGISARDRSGAFHVPVGGQGVPARDPDYLFTRQRPRIYYVPTYYNDFNKINHTTLFEGVDEQYNFIVIKKQNYDRIGNVAKIILVVSVVFLIIGIVATNAPLITTAFSLIFLGLITAIFNEVINSKKIERHKNSSI